MGDQNKSINSHAVAKIPDSRSADRTFTGPGWWAEQISTGTQDINYRVQLLSGSTGIQREGLHRIAFRFF